MTSALFGGIDGRMWVVAVYQGMTRSYSVCTIKADLLQLTPIIDNGPITQIRGFQNDGPPFVPPR